MKRISSVFSSDIPKETLLGGPNQGFVLLTNCRTVNDCCRRRKKQMSELLGSLRVQDRPSLFRRYRLISRLISVGEPTHCGLGRFSRGLLAGSRKHDDEPPRQRLYTPGLKIPAQLRTYAAQHRCEKVGPWLRLGPSRLGLLSKHEVGRRPHVMR